MGISFIRHRGKNCSEGVAGSYGDLTRPLPLLLKINKMKTPKREEIRYMKSMMESCYTYGGIGMETYNFKRYLLKYKEILGKETFEKTYKEKAEKLKNYIVQPCVYSDADGLSYNSLVKKPKKIKKTLAI